jgi:hypothetical protein
MEFKEASRCGYTTTIRTVATTIYLRDETIFEDFANGSFKLPNSILFGNK